jgi:hypothetical protein
LLAQDPKLARQDPVSGAITLQEIPAAHGDHLHIGQFTVSSKEASGLKNPSVWSALVRKGLARVDGPVDIALTAEGVSYHTDFGDRFLATADH